MTVTPASAQATPSNLRVKTLEIRWHDSKPISSCDFQPRPLKRARPASSSARDKDTAYANTSESYKLATGGEDNNVRIWLVHPNILPPSLVHEFGKASNNGGATPTPHPPRIEYLSTLSRHTAAVNVVRWSPNGELIASAGDDGMIIVWGPTANPSTAFGEAGEEAQYDKEHWKPRTTFPCTTMQVYDLAWSPTGEYIIAGGTDNVARIFSTSDGKCVRELAEHSHYVQGVSWDPMNEFIATQSSDRSVHVYSVSTKQGMLEVHAVGKNTRMTIKHARTPSVGGSTSANARPRNFRRDSITSETESAITTLSEFKEDVHQMIAQPTPSTSSTGPVSGAAPLTPTASVASTPSVMFPPPLVERAASSRRSSFSSQAPGSPATTFSHRVGRSPSPMPPLPAIRSSPSPANFASSRLYGDESFTNFFRRLTFSPDGGLLMTPAGQFEDPSLQRLSTYGSKGEEGSQTRGRKPRGNVDVDPTSSSSVFIYSRMNFAKPPIGQIPGLKKPSVAVKFSPILYELRPGVGGPPSTNENREKDPQIRPILVERGRDDSTHVDINGPLPTIVSSQSAQTQSGQEALTPVSSSSKIAPPPSNSQPATPSSASEALPPPIPAPTTASVFALPYRMLFAIATMDTITIHDTQQAGPICLFTRLHYDEFTDLTWSPDGQCLLLSARDGYCTMVIFDEPIPPYATQQHGLQLQSIAQSHGAPSNPAHGSSAVFPFPTPSPTPAPLSLAPLSSSTPGTSSVPPKRPLTPASSDAAGPINPDNSALSAASAGQEKPTEPTKKKRRVELTKVGEL